MAALEPFLYFVTLTTIICLMVYIIWIYNGLVKLKLNIAKSYANIDVLLKQRSDELPKLIDTVKGYMKHEKETLLNLTRMRSKLAQATTLRAKADLNNQISEGLKTIFAVAENYPKLRANENFLQLQSRITGLENEIADRREFYNDSVTNYNYRIQSFPDTLIAKLFKYKEEDLFQASEDEKNKVAL